MDKFYTCPKCGKIMLGTYPPCPCNDKEREK